MNTQPPSGIQPRRRGIALVLVVLVMALAAVLGYAMLSASSVQATAGGNALAAATARAQAESGIHYAMYYLLNNTLPGAGISWSNVTFATTSPAATIPGSVSISIAPMVNHCCWITATGSSGAAGGGAITRTINAEVQVGTPLPINQGGAFNSTVSLSGTYTFTSATAGVPAIAATSTVTNNGTINGNVSAPKLTGTGTQINGTLTAAPVSAPAPSSYLSVNNYTQQYVYQGAVCTPTLLGATVSSNTTLGPTPSNPLGIYYTTGNLTVSAAKSLNVNGTLVVQGTLTNTGSISITPISPTGETEMPALIVNTKLTTSGGGRTLTANGVVYVGQGINGTGATATSSIQINGALLVSTNGISLYSGTLGVTYNPARTNIPNFDTTDWDSTSGVKIIYWSE
jgi:Tfp pilus assembly protein PilX